MPEYDAFGREIGDDPLASLREATAAPAEKPPAPEVPAARAQAAPPPVEVERPRPTASVEAEPPRATAPVEAEPPRPLVFVRPRRSRGARRAVTMSSILVIGALVAGIGALSAFVQDRLEGLAEPIPSEITAPIGLDQRSLLRPANLAAAIESLRQSGKGRPVTLRITPGQIDATLAGPVGISQVQVTADQQLRTLGSTDVGAFPPTIPYARIDPTAPQRLVRNAVTPARQIDHVQLLPGRPVRWRAVFRGGETVTGDAAGRP